VIATGDGANQGLALQALEDLNIPPGPGNFKLRIGHFAPFAAGDALADVRLQDGTVILDDVPYGAVTGYLELAAGEYDLKITSPDGLVIYIDPLPVSFAAGVWYSAYATGDGSNQPLGVFAWQAGAEGFFLPLAEYGVELAPETDEASGNPGETVMYSLDLTNNANITDTITVSAAGNAWEVELPETSFELGAGEMAEVMVHVTIPADAGEGETDAVTITALAGDGVTSDSSELTTEVAPFAAVQIAHLAPFAADPGTAVTVTLDGTPILSGFEYADSTGYVEVAPGEHLVEIYPAGASDPAITGTVDLEAGMDYTVLAVGDGVNQTLELVALMDDNSAPAAGSFKLRIGHFAPFAPGLALADVRLDDGTVVLDDVAFGDVAAYLELAAGEYDLQITSPDGMVVYIDIAPVTLADGQILSVFAVGEGANQALGAFALPAGEVGFLLPLETPEEEGFMVYLPIVGKE
jgi:hypothetical protein